MIDSRQPTRRRVIILIIAAAFSILIIAENVHHAVRRELTLFAPPPEPQTSLTVGTYIVLPLILLWGSWGYLRKRKHALVSFSTAACLIFIAMDYFLPDPGPVKKTFFMIEEGSKIYNVGLENFSDEPFLTKQGNPIGISLNYTLSFPAGGTYLIGISPVPASRVMKPEDAGIDTTGSALRVREPQDWLTVHSGMNVKRVETAIPGFIIYGGPKNGFCLFSLAAELLKDGPGLTRYLVQIQVSGQQTQLDQMAVLSFETRKAYDVREFYESAVKEHMPVCSRTRAVT